MRKNLKTEIKSWSCRLTWVQESCHVKGFSSWSASHHVSLCSSRPNSSQEPEENKVAPLRPIALRRSSQWRKHQKLRENISTQGTVRSESQCTRKCSESVPQKSVKCSLYTWAFSLSWRLHLWSRGSHPAVHVSLSGASSTWASLLLFKPFD